MLSTLNTSLRANTKKEALGTIFTPRKKKKLYYFCNIYPGSSKYIIYNIGKHFKTLSIHTFIK